MAYGFGSGNGVKTSRAWVLVNNGVLGGLTNLLFSLEGSRLNECYSYTGHGEDGLFASRHVAAAVSRRDLWHTMDGRNMPCHLPT